MTTQRTTLDREGEPAPLEFNDTRGSWALARFDSVAEFLGAAMARLPAVNETPDMLESCHKTEKTQAQRASWYGIPSGETSDVVTALLDGYEPGRALVEELAAQLPADIAPPVAVRRRRRWADSGDSVEMQRVWGGALDRAWQRTAPTQVHAPRVVRLMVSVSANWQTPASEMAWRGVAALALTHILSAKGYAVEINATMPAREAYPNSKIEDLCVEVLLKQAQKPLDMLTLCGALTVPGFFRHVGFLVYAHGRCKLAANFGYAASHEETPFTDADCIGGFDSCKDVASATRMVRAALTKIQAR